MKLRFDLTLGKDSFSLAVPPGADCERLPLLMTSCGHYHATTDYFTEREGLDSHLLLYTLDGCGLLDTAGQTMRLHPAQAVFFDCRPHQFYRPGPEGWTFRWLHATGTGCTAFAKRIHPQHPDALPVRDPAAFSRLFDDLFSVLRKPSVDLDVEANLAVTRMLTELALSRSPMRNAGEGRHRGDVAQAVAFIERHWREKIDAGDILSPAHISPFHFTRLFKEQTGRSPYEYLIQHRLNMAVRDLLQTDGTIAEIAVNNGFGDATQFIRRFRRHYGTTPATFRRHVH